MSQHEYTIDIPGLADIFILPIDSFDNKDLRRERIQRFKTKRTPIPSTIDWIPDSIRYLDDIQDMLIVGLTLARPLLRKLPSRFVPYLGWALLLNDILNLSTAILGVATGGRVPKRQAEKTIQDLQAYRTGIPQRVDRFMNENNWLGFALQAGQVLESATGYGIRLGPLMGMVSDSFWGTIRALQGKKVRIRGPLPSDPIWKAASILSRAWMAPMLGTALTLQEHEQIIAANNIATQIIEEKIPPQSHRTRQRDMSNTRLPVYVPWNRASRVALHEAGIPIKTNRKVIANFFPTKTSYGKVSAYVNSFRNGYESQLRTRYGESQRAQIVQLIHKEGGNAVWDHVTHTKNNIQGRRDFFQDIFLRAIERNVFPPANASSIKQLQWAARARALASAQGLSWPTKENLQQAAIDTMGGFTTR